MTPLAVDLESHWPGWLAPLVEPVANYLFEGKASHEDMEFVEACLYTWIFVIPGLALLSFLGTSKMERVPGPLQNLLEAAVGALQSFTRSLVSPPYDKVFFPYIGAVFIYIFAMNVWGVVPGMQAATSTVNTTAALAVCTFVLTHYAGFVYAGTGYLEHFVGEPRWLGPLMVPLHIVGEIARPASLTLRLFGNIGGEEKAIAIFVSFGIATGAFIPIQVPLLALGVFTSFVQALIFALLSAVYIGGALPHHHHPEEEHAHPQVHPHGDPHGHGAPY
jgi:F-type H+-transporting ATPase subunit a